MRERLGTATGRGLLAARTGEFVVLVGATWFLLAQLQPRVLVLGVLLAGLPGLVSARRLWVGRYEFGPEHERTVRPGIYLFAVASILLLLSLLSFQTFPSPSLGIDFPGENVTDEPGTVHRFKDLLPPLVMMGAAMTAEVASGALILWNLVGQEWRRFVATYAGAGVMGGVLAVWVGVRLVGQFEQETGSFADTTPAANFYYGRFLDQVLFIVAMWAIATRVVLILFLRRALAKVAKAELEGTGTTEPAPSP